MSGNTTLRKHLLLSFDVGTAKSSVVWAECRGDEELTVDVSPIIFDGVATEVSSHIAYDHSIQDWIWGSVLHANIKSRDNPNGTIQRDDIITMAKLCFDHSKNKKIREGVDRQLKRVGRLKYSSPECPNTKIERYPTYKDVFREFLHRLYCFTIRSIRKCTPTVEQMDVKCILSFPACWASFTGHDFGVIARQAGLTNITYISEPEAAAAYVIRKNMQSTSSVSDH